MNKDINDDSPIVLPTKERIDRGEVYTKGGKVFVKAECKLDVYYNKKTKDGKRWITQLEKEAGDEIYKDFVGSGIQSKGTWITEFTDNSHTGSHFTDSQIRSRQKFYKAMDSLTPMLANIIWEVVCLNRGLGDLDYRAGVPQKLLKASLGQLVKHYKWN